MENGKCAACATEKNGENTLHRQWRDSEKEE